MMNRTTVKSSTIFVAEGRKTKVFRSLDEMPADLRRRLEKSTNGNRSATILIADRRGRDEIARALNGLPAAFQTKVAPKVAGMDKAAQCANAFAETLRSTASLRWVRYGVAASTGVAIWLLLRMIG
jgi:hypothetical protein